MVAKNGALHYYWSRIFGKAPEKCVEKIFWALVKVVLFWALVLKVVLFEDCIIWRSPLSKKPFLSRFLLYFLASFLCLNFEVLFPQCNMCPVNYVFLRHCKKTCNYIKFKDCGKKDTTTQGNSFRVTLIINLISSKLLEIKREKVVNNSINARIPIFLVAI